LWLRQDEAVVTGRRSLRDRSAQAVLDDVGAAMARVRAAVSQRLGLERAAFFGSVEEGSQLVLSFRFFAEDERALDEVARRLRAELPDSTWRERRVVPSVVADDSARAAVAAAMTAAGRGFVADPPRLPHSTDFGFIARALPAALIGVGREEGWTMHADEGAEQFAGPDGVAAGLAIAQVVALASASLSEPA
jgi:metal-dependent amidase/aminoacylase/carboxypeptidase family protein